MSLKSKDIKTLEYKPEYEIHEMRTDKSIVRNIIKVYFRVS